MINALTTNVSLWPPASTTGGSTMGASSVSQSQNPLLAGLGGSSTGSSDLASFLSALDGASSSNPSSGSVSSSTPQSAPNSLTAFLSALRSQLATSASVSAAGSDTASGATATVGSSGTAHQIAAAHPGHHGHHGHGDGAALMKILAQQSSPGTTTNGVSGSASTTSLNTSA